MSKEICDNCPFLATIEVGREIAEDNPTFYMTDAIQQEAIGSIIEDKTILQAIVERIGCDEPELADGAYLTCPHARTVGDTRLQVFGSNNQSRSERKFSAFNDADKDDGSEKVPGQYL